MAVKEVKTVLPVRQDKKRVVRFETDEEGAAIGNVYVSNEAIKKLGNPEQLEVIIRPYKES